MRKSLLAALAALLATSLAMPTIAVAVPPKDPSLARALVERGVIPEDATPDQAQRIYADYVQRKIGGKSGDHGNPLARQAVLQADRSGQPANQHGRLRPDNKRYDVILTLLVEFAGEDTGPDGVVHSGPLHNEIAQPAADNNVDFWVEDFSTEHYRSMLFDKAPQARSMSTYFIEQSGGVYSVDGNVTMWVQLPHSEWFYGADSVAGGAGSDNLNGPVWRVVRDAVEAAGDSVDWAKFDNEDVYDIDGDGIIAEPDGYVDHIQVIHAGADQAAGGGAQGDDAIWSHSWWVDYGNGDGPMGFGGVQTSDADVWVGPYTINPEDGTVGVFVHEFAHDLGLPDQYDIVYSGEASTGFWTLMSSGSWLGDAGEPLGTSPSALNVWEKWVLGWLDPMTMTLGQTRNNVALRDSAARGRANKAIQVRLPDFDYSYRVTDPYSGSYMWYSGQGDMYASTLVSQGFDIPLTGATLDFWTWYDIETDWDYGYVEVSTDGGSTWAYTETTLSTTSDPNGNNDGFGITGASGGWVSGHADLSAYSGESVLVRFRYETDEAVTMPGWAIDDISVSAAGFSDDVEAGPDGWTADGWTITDGTAYGTAFHYYMAEWRQPTGFDSSMLNWYNILADGTNAEFFAANPGMLVWYRNSRYGDNLAGVHPWAGQLTLVDSHPQLVTALDSGWLGGVLWGPAWPLELELPFRTRMQLFDAAFSMKPTAPVDFSSWWSLYEFPTHVDSQSGVATFDDTADWVDKTYEPFFGMDPSLDYFLYAATPGVETPDEGVSIQIKRESPMAAMVSVDARRP